MSPVSTKDLETLQFIEAFSKGLDRFTCRLDIEAWLRLSRTGVCGRIQSLKRKGLVKQEWRRKNAPIVLTYRGQELLSIERIRVRIYAAIAAEVGNEN